MTDKNTIKEFYNNVYKAGDIRDNRRLYRWIVGFLNPSVHSRLLDVGCGVGCLLYEANKQNFAVFGLDISQGALVKAKQGLPCAKLCVADGEKIPFQDGAFDNVVSLGSIEHFLQPETGIKEIKRLLKPGGKAVLLLPNSFYLGDILNVLFRGKPKEQWQIQERLMDREEWRKMIEESGLKVDKICGYNKYPELFQEGMLRLKSVKKYIKAYFMKYLCPFNLSWQFVYVCRK